VGKDAFDLPPNARFAKTLRQAAESALGEAIGAAWDGAAMAKSHRLPASAGRRIEGLFTGGTLCAEAQVILSAGGREIRSNAPIPGVADMRAGTNENCDKIFDLGADEYTLGRPHPMIDPTVRDDAIRTALADSRIGVILIDLVIGHGAHPDPAGHLVGLVADRSKTAPLIIGSVTGTERDPQCKSHQVRRLQEGGILVAPSNAQACELALALAASSD
jgi:hypothetical protein